MSTSVFGTLSGGGDTRGVSKGRMSPAREDETGCTLILDFLSFKLSTNLQL
jgi:hypothetical protein